MIIYFIRELVLQFPATNKKEIVNTGATYVKLESIYRKVYNTLGIFFNCLRAIYAYIPSTPVISIKTYSIFLFYILLE